MPLINCPECGKEISDQAPACPHCTSSDLTKLISLPASPSSPDGAQQLTMGPGGCGLPQCGQGRCAGMMDD